MTGPNQQPTVETAVIFLKRNGFLRTLLRKMVGMLQGIGRVEEAAGFISMVGQKMGQALDAQHHTVRRLERLTRSQVAADVQGRTSP